MNKKIEYLNDNINVIDENGNKIKRDLVDNIENILIVENNIEEIKHEEEKLAFEQYTTELNNKIINTITVTVFLLTLLTLISTMIINFPGTIITGIATIFMGSSTLTSLIVKKINTNYSKNIKVQQAILNEKLQEETKKLENLKKNSKTIQPVAEPTTKEISTSELISNLRNKLQIIKDYQYNKKRFTNYFYLGKIEEELMKKGYSSNDIELIKELINNDIKEKSIKKVQKGFVKKLK